MEKIRLVQTDGNGQEVLEGIGPDEFCISDAMVNATIDYMRIFPHIVHAVAANVARAKGLNQQEHLETMGLVRDSLIAAIYTRNTSRNAIMSTTTSGNM